jgi:hypothetical protein
MRLMYADGFLETALMNSREQTIMPSPSRTCSPNCNSERRSAPMRQDGIFEFRFSNFDLRSLWRTKRKSHADSRRRFFRCRDHAPAEPGRHGLSLPHTIICMVCINPEGVDPIGFSNFDLRSLWRTKRKSHADSRRRFFDAAIMHPRNLDGTACPSRTRLSAWYVSTPKGWTR